MSDEEIDWHQFVERMKNRPLPEFPKRGGSKYRGVIPSLDMEVSRLEEMIRVLTEKIERLETETGEGLRALSRIVDDLSLRRWNK